MQSKLLKCVPNFCDIEYFSTFGANQGRESQTVLIILFLFRAFATISLAQYLERYEKDHKHFLSSHTQDRSESKIKIHQNI